MLNDIIQRWTAKREIQDWLTDHSLRAAEALSDLALRLEAQALEEIQRLGPLASKSDFIAFKLAPQVRDAADTLATELVEDARADLKTIAPVEVFRVRCLHYAEPPAGILRRTARSLSDRLPAWKSDDLRTRSRNLITHSLLKGSKNCLSLLEQLEGDYRSAAARARDAY